MTIEKLLGAWVDARAQVDRLYAEMATAAPAKRLLLDRLAGDQHAVTGALEATMAATPAAGVEDVARKLVAGAIFAHEMAAPNDDPGPGWPLILSTVRDLLAMAPAVAATPGLAGIGLTDLLTPVALAA